MIAPGDLPLWAAIIVGALTIGGAAFTLVGSFGLWRLRSFYDRVHTPTLGTSLGTVLIIVASMICFTVLESRVILQELLIFVFVSVTTPVTLMLLARAALYRDRAEGNASVPPADPQPILKAREAEPDA
ncbi:potassium:proton antiporter [Arsenicitalea aurantiaca]|uniref:Potassium:proton antiporter n=1 Tax=Arsenicitalea aurantiaca TaxID=1783274 RepID=A0A433XEU1_9HYPH|nr:monovalent cation/H(+) antiporter subunit G [Arsenicitalea aurantiaca]RUT32576.1 potassium:proton antiporter [Arsenicitalea aurantiaca]